MKKSDIIALVPTYNNPKSIQKVANDILQQGYKLIIVDDGSTPKVDIKDKNLTLLRHEKNLGKGMAIRTGAQKAKELGYQYFVTLDGDGQHLASQIEFLIQALDKKEQIIIGARNFEIQNVPKSSKFGRWFSNIWAGLSTEMNITDSLSGFRLYPISILDLDIKTKKFDWEMEVLVKHAWKKRPIKEKTIECYYPKPEERVSHFKKFKDTMAIVMVHLRLLPLKPLLKRLEKNR